MRARSAKQRFPVQQWKEDLGILQSKCIKIHLHRVDKTGGLINGSNISLENPPDPTLENIPCHDFDFGDTGSPSPREEIIQTPTDLKRTLLVGEGNGPGHLVALSNSHSTPEAITEDDVSAYEEKNIIEPGDHHLNLDDIQISLPKTVCSMSLATFRSSRQSFNPQRPSTAVRIADGAHFNSNTLALPSPMCMLGAPPSRSSMLSIDIVIGEKKDFKLQKVDLLFTDSNGEFYNAFEAKLGTLSGKNSESELCIEEYLIRSEKCWFDKFRDARLGSSSNSEIVLFRMSSI
jgi:alpha-1,3-glucan synthase